MADKAQVQLFLRTFKKYWPPICVVIPREENNAALVALGWTPYLRRDCVLNLAVQNYSEGPEKDRGGSGEIWVFGMKVDEIEIYVKLKLVPRREDFLAKCISFHPAKAPLKYPFTE